jgi:hypothetical protein
MARRSGAMDAMASSTEQVTEVEVNAGGGRWGKGPIYFVREPIIETPVHALLALADSIVWISVSVAVFWAL